MVKLKVFISSEMGEPQDEERRRAARTEIEAIGHLPVCFEDLPSRRIPSNKKVPTVCIELVRDSDVCLAVVDDTVTPTMAAEIKEAMMCLGSDRVVFYFTRNVKRDKKAEDLWNLVKQGWIVNQFERPDELAREIARSFASFAGDALKRSTERSRKLEDTIDLRSRKSWEKKLTLKKGDKVTVTCSSVLPLFKFKAGLYSREDYFKRKPMNFLDEFKFGRQTSKPHFTCKVRITEDDDYYLLIKADPYSAGVALINIELKIE